MSARTSFAVGDRVRITGRHYTYSDCVGVVVADKINRYLVHSEDGFSFGLYPFDALASADDLPIRAASHSKTFNVVMKQDEDGELRITVDGVPWAPIRHSAVMGVSGLIGFAGTESALAVAAAQLVREVDLMLAGGEQMMRHAEKCSECGLGGEGPVKDALQSLRPLLMGSAR